MRILSSMSGGHARCMVWAKKSLLIWKLPCSPFRGVRSLSRTPVFAPSNGFNPITRSLDVIGGLLRECADHGGVKKVLMRADIRRKVKQCDDMLSHSLRIFQVRPHLQYLPLRSSDHSPPARRRRCPSIFTLHSLLKAHAVRYYASTLSDFS